MRLAARIVACCLGDPVRTLISCVLALAVVGGLAACRAESSVTTAVLDLVQLFPTAETRAAEPPEKAFQILDVDLGGETKRSIRAPAPSRIVWVVRVPRDAVIRLGVGFPPARGGERRRPAAVRIGISDARLYEILLRRPADELESAPGRWAPVEVDLRRYAGWQWSLFYRPSRHPWRIVFSLDAGAEEEGAFAYWGAPRIEGRR